MGTELKTITWTFSGILELESQLKMKELDLELVDVKYDDPHGFEDITLRGTEDNLREFFAFFWDLDVDSEEINEVFEEQV